MVRSGRGEPDLGEVIEIQSVLRRVVVGWYCSAGAGPGEIVVVVLLGLVVVKVVSVDLVGERHAGEVTEKLIDGPGNMI